MGFIRNGRLKVSCPQLHFLNSGGLRPIYYQTSGSIKPGYWIERRESHLYPHRRDFIKFSRN